MKVVCNVMVDNETTGYSHPVHVSQKALNAVLFDFNPSSNEKVTRIKALHAALIQEMEDVKSAAGSSPAQLRCAAIAITELEATQMRAVKALFAK